MICSSCGIDKEEKLFATFKNRNGELRRRGICWKCRSENAARNAQEKFEERQAWRKKYNTTNRDKRRERDLLRRAELKEVAEKAKDVPCADCGARWPAVAMDFDHVKGAKINSVSSMMSGAYRPEIVLAEIAKCEVVCACCHRIRTANRKENAAAIPRQAIVGDNDLKNLTYKSPEGYGQTSEVIDVPIGEFVKRRLSSIDWDAQSWNLKSDAEIAKDLNVSVSTVRRNRPEEPHAKSINWREQPWGKETYKAMAKRLGVSKTTVLKYKRLEMDSKIDWERQPWGTETNAVIARLTGTSESTVALYRPDHIPSEKIDWKNQPWETESVKDMALRLKQSIVTVYSNRRKLFGKKVKERITGVPCDVEGCDKLVVARGLCAKHYQQKKVREKGQK